MAIQFSDKQLNFARKKIYGNLYFTNENLNFFMKAINKVLIILMILKVNAINFKRNILKNFIKIKKKNNYNFDCKINLKIEEKTEYSNLLRKNNFVFIKNFLDEKSYSQLLYGWPSINFFTHRSKIIKYYSSGFNIDKNNKSRKNANLEKNLVLKNFYSFLQSKKFENFINEFLKFENLSFYNYSIDSSMAGDKSFLIPHIDGVMSKEECCYNFIYFVDGNEENVEYSGATGIYEDNNFDKPLFIPDTLRNSLLVYKSTVSFFHGFKLTTMPKNIFRKTVNFQFFSNKDN